MDTKEVKTVMMFGPSLSKPGELDEREIPVADIQAYKAIGWVAGSKPRVEPVSDPIPAPAPKEQPKARGRK